MLEGNSKNRPIRRISMLFIVVRRIRQCTELHIMTVSSFVDSWAGFHCNIYK